MHMCLEEMIFEKRPRKVPQFAKLPKFHCRADLQISSSYQWIKKSFLQAKLIFSFILRLNESSSF